MTKTKMTKTTTPHEGATAEPGPKRYVTGAELWRIHDAANALRDAALSYAEAGDHDHVSPELDEQLLAAARAWVATLDTAATFTSPKGAGPARCSVCKEPFRSGEAVRVDVDGSLLHDTESETHYSASDLDALRDQHEAMTAFHRKRATPPAAPEAAPERPPCSECGAPGHRCTRPASEPAPADDGGHPPGWEAKMAADPPARYALDGHLYEDDEDDSEPPAAAPQEPGPSSQPLPPCAMGLDVRSWVEALEHEPVALSIEDVRRVFMGGYDVGAKHGAPGAPHGGPAGPTMAMVPVVERWPGCIGIPLPPNAYATPFGWCWPEDRSSPPCVVLHLRALAGLPLLIPAASPPSPGGRTPNELEAGLIRTVAQDTARMEAIGKAIDDRLAVLKSGDTSLHGGEVKTLVGLRRILTKQLPDPAPPGDQGGEGGAA